jgi:hypothetical protein
LQIVLDEKKNRYRQYDQNGILRKEGSRFPDYPACHHSRAHVMGSHLRIKIETKFPWMRTRLKRCNLIVSLVRNPGTNDIFGEDVSP